MKSSFITLIHQLQDSICAALEKVDGKATFREDTWERDEGGGGKTRVIQDGAVFEKGGVNTSVVSGKVTDVMRTQLKINGDNWFACGISIVLHPANPFVPIIHCNYRMFEMYNENGEITDRWFGGGTDLTPAYLFEEDALHFHQVLKDVCDKYDPGYYREYKKNCDNYFVNTHRNNERRGIGGIFYDYKKGLHQDAANHWLQFASDAGSAFTQCYIPVVIKRKDTPFTAEQRKWQEIRRGRYIEFNLVHDKGTIFGLKTNGRTESILMSLPPVARFEYDHQPVPGSEEQKLLQVCLQPIEWIN